MTENCSTGTLDKGKTGSSGTQDRNKKTYNPGNPDKETLLRMNRSHASLRGFALPFIDWVPEMRILDVGCGGGATIAEMLELSENSRIDGVDYSPVSVACSEETNRKYLGGRVRICLGNVIDLPFEDEVYDLVTTVESTYFWPDMDKGFSEIFRVLKKGGTAAVINEGSDPDAHPNWPNPDIRIMIYRPEELTAFMKKAGFENIRVNHGDGDVIMVRGDKIE